MPSRHSTPWWTPDFRSQRLYVVAAVALILIAFGAFIGLQIANHLHRAYLQTELDQLSSRVLERLEQILEESDRLFSQLDKLGLEHCSDEQLLAMRTEIFAARFLRDIGGIRQSDLYCSTALGRLNEPLQSGKPDLILNRGLGIRTDRSVLASDNMRTMVVEREPFNALVDPRLVTDLIAGLEGISIELGLALKAPDQWHPFQRTIDDLLSTQGRSSAMQSSVNCSDIAGLCVRLLRANLEVAPGQRESRLVLTALGALLGLGTTLIGLGVIRHRQSPLSSLRRAIRGGRIQAVYQPILKLPEQSLYGLEALARWRDDYGKWVDTEHFIQLAERGGLIHEISDLMIRRIGEELGTWLSTDTSRRITINVAPAELADRRLIKRLEQHLVERGIEPQQVILEVTERTMLLGSATTARIAELTQRGFHFYADDFGMGYCGLAYLNELDMDGIKISQSFTAAVGTDSPKAALVPRIIELAHELGLKVIVEGVETRAQCDGLSGLEPVMAQGWYFAREMAARDVIKHFR